VSGESELSFLRDQLRELIAHNQDERAKIARQIAENRRIFQELRRAMEANSKWIIMKERR
jgi:hypothetical protein